MKDNLEQLAAAMTALTLTLGLAGLVVRFVLLPWLRDHLVKPIQETNRQVTVNGHRSDTPTLLDKVDEVQQAQAVAASMFEGHMSASEEDSANLWAAIEGLGGHQPEPPGKHRDRRSQYRD